MLAVIVAGALAAPAVWITMKTKLALQTTKDVSGTAIHVDTGLGRITLHGKVSSVQKKVNDTNEIK